MKPAARPPATRQRRASAGSMSRRAKAAQRLPQGRRAGRRTVGDQRREPVEQQVRRGGDRRAGARPARRPPPRRVAARARQATREHGGGQRVEVGLARQRQVERLEAGGRPRAAAAAPRSRGWRRTRFAPGGGRPRARWSSSSGPTSAHREQRERVVERARLVLRLRRGQRPGGATRGVERQRGRALEEGGGRGESAARLRARRGTLELRGDVLVGHRRRLRAVPGAAIRVGLGIGRLGERAMDLAPLLGGGCPVDRRANERMAEDDAGREREQAAPTRRVAPPTRGSRAAPPPATRAPRSPVGSPRRRATGAAHHAAALASRRVKLSSIRADSGTAAGRPNPPASCAASGRAAAPPGRADSRASRRRCRSSTRSSSASRQDGLQQRPRIAMTEGPDVELGKPAQRVAQLAGREHERDPSASEPASDERRGPEPTHDRATARRRPRRGAAAPRPPPTADRGPRARRGTDSGPARR